MALKNKLLTLKREFMLTISSGAAAYIMYRACTEAGKWIQKKIDESKSKK